MATWSSRRKLLYGGSIFAIIAGVIGTVFFFYFYKPPTCFDGARNGKEQGIDCGGICAKLCQGAFLTPKIEWGGGKAEKVADGLYNLASYIINPNTTVAALNVPYKFTLFDYKGILIAERQGYIDIPAHRNTLVFESAVSVGKRVPTKVTFEFLAPPLWFKSHDTIGGLVVVDKKYAEDEKMSSLEIHLENKDLVPYQNITVGAVLYDANDNVIGFSKTIVDSLPAQGGKEVAPFTWPLSRNGKVVTIEAIPVVDPVHD
jgi:hypothetical protein